MDDYVQQSALLINTFGLETDIYNQLVTFNSTFLVSTFLRCLSNRWWDVLIIGA